MVPWLSISPGEYFIRRLGLYNYLCRKEDFFYFSYGPMINENPVPIRLSDLFQGKQSWQILKDDIVCIVPSEDLIFIGSIQLDLESYK